MAMGGGGGSAPPAGLSPMQRSNYDIGREMVYGGNRTQGGYYAAKKYGGDLSQLAQGGLVNLGMWQARQGLNAPAIGPGVAQRNAARYGVTMDPTQQQALRQQGAMADAQTRVATENQARLGLTEAMRDMRFGGIKV